MNAIQFSTRIFVSNHLVFAFILLLAATSWSAEEPTKKTNFLLITVDDMNCDSIGVFGCDVPNISPNIDRLASEGLRFEHAHVTIAVCQPCRAVWLTGRYPHRNGARGFERITRGVPTLLEQFKQHGYRTGVLAKVPHCLPSRQSAWDVTVPASQLKQGRDPEAYYQHAKAFLEDARKQAVPFFLMANSQDPHRPFAGSDQEKSRRGGKQRAGFPEVANAYKPDEVTVPGFLPDLPAVRLEMAEYYTSVRRADRIVGAVLRALDDTGLADSTLVMFLSDHGLPLPFAKTNCYYHSTRTPWIVRWPGKVKPGMVDGEHFVSGIDLTPTVLEALELPPLEEIDGRSFLPLLSGSKQAGREHVFTHFHKTSGRNEYPMRSVQDRQFGYIYNAWSDGKTIFRNESQNGRTMNAMRAAAAGNPKVAARVEQFVHRTPEEFYDYSQDPDALVNLIDDPRYQKQIAGFRDLLKEHMQATSDPLLATFEKK